MPEELKPTHSGKSYIKWIGRHRGFLALIAVFLIGVVFSPTNLRGQRTFVTPDTQRDTFRQASEYGILACGMTVVILTGGIDLSVGSILGLIATLFAYFLIPRGWSPWVAVPACLIIATGIGAVNGTLISVFRIQPFVATLAMMVAARGMAKFAYGGEKVSTAIKDPVTKAIVVVPEPPIFGYIDTHALGGAIARVTIIFLACVAVLWLVITQTRFGRHLYAIGGNEEAARLSGIRVGWAKIMAYAICGFTAGVAGICHAAQERQGDPEAGFTYELDAIAAVVIGGTNLMGGRGGILLTLLGTLIIGYIDKILSINAVGEAVRLMVKGGIIVGAVLIQQRKK